MSLYQRLLTIFLCAQGQLRIRHAVTGFRQLHIEVKWLRVAVCYVCVIVALMSTQPV